MNTRLFNFCFALLFLIIFFPLFIIISILIKIETKGPVFFKQTRVGKNEHPFQLYKFRSMYLHADSPEKLGPIKHTHTLVTPIGYILRRSKLDEIPQFINILRGEMNLIGPRPCLYSKIKIMSPQERRRFQVLPGMTGWAEINGNVELDWHEQLALDLWYLDHQNFLLDCLILWKTAITVLLGSTKNNNALQQAKTYLKEIK